jgi:hypothetical protein
VGQVLDDLLDVRQKAEVKVTADSYFAIVPEWILDSTYISDRGVRVFAVLSRYADQEGHAHPSRTTLANRCFCSVDSVDRALKELEAAGAVEVKRRIENGAYVTNEYIVQRGGSRTAAARGRGIGAA